MKVCKWTPQTCGCVTCVCVCVCVCVWFLCYARYIRTVVSKRPGSLSKKMHEWFSQLLCLYVVETYPAWCCKTSCLILQQNGAHLLFLWCWVCGSVNLRPPPQGGGSIRGMILRYWEQNSTGRKSCRIVSLSNKNPPWSAEWGAAD